MSFKNLFFRRIISLFFILTFYFPLNSAEPFSWHQFKTSNFNIFFMEDQQGYAVQIASYLERENKHIGNFLKYSLPDKLNIYLLFSDASKKTIKSEIDSADEKNICIYTDFSSEYNFKILSEILMKKFLIFLTAENSPSFFKKFNQIDPWLYQALSSYITLNFDKRFDIVMRDIVLNRKISFSSLDEILNEDLTSSLALQVSFISFIDKIYGRERLLHTIKNISYFKGFIKSLIKVTGETNEEIFDKYDAYLKLRYPILPFVKDKIISYPSKLDFQTCGFAVEEKNKTIAFLQKNKFDYRLLITHKNNKNETVRLLKNDLDGRELVNIYFLEENSIGILAQLENKSEIKIINIKNGKCLKTLTFPFMHITSLYSSKRDNDILFSASVGGNQSIYIYDIENNLLDKISSDKYNDTSPVVLKNKKIYYISLRDVFKIIETDYIGITERIIFSSISKISDLVYHGDELYFSLKNGEVFNIYALNLKNFRKRKITSVNTLARMPRIFCDKLLYLSYQNGKNVLLQTDISTSLIDDRIEIAPFIQDQNNHYYTPLIEGEGFRTYSKMNKFNIPFFVGKMGNVITIPWLYLPDIGIEISSPICSNGADFQLLYEYMLPPSRIIIKYNHKDVELLSENFNLHRYWLNSGIERGSYDSGSIQMRLYSKRMMWFGFKFDVVNEKYNGKLLNEESINYLQGGVVAGFNNMKRRGFLFDSGFNVNFNGQYNNCVTEKSFSFSHRELTIDFAYSWGKSITFNTEFESSIYNGKDIDFHRIFISKGIGNSNIKEEYFFGEKMVAFSSEIYYHLFNGYLNAPLSGMLSTVSVSTFLRGMIIENSEIEEEFQNLKTVGGALSIQIYPLFFLRLDYIHQLHQNLPSDDELFFMLNFSHRW